MKRIFMILGAFLFTINLFAVHDFFVNDEEVVELAVGDSAFFQFNFENIGNSANLNLWLDIDNNHEISTFDLNLFSSDSILTDGDLLDQTSEDGVYEFGINWNFSFSSTNIIVELIDEDISDFIVIIPGELEDSYEISGTVRKEDGVWPYLAGVPVFCLYNVETNNLLELIESILDGDIMEWITSHYVFAALSGLDGSYSFDVPQDTASTTCLLYANDLLGLLTADLVAPEYQFVEVNENMDLDFIFMNPEAHINFNVQNEDAAPVQNAMTLINSLDDEYNFVDFALTDEEGNCSISLLASNYTFMVNATGYLPYLEPFLAVANGDDLQFDISLVTLNDLEDNKKVDLSRKLTLTNYPNPFNPSTSISFFLSSNAECSLNIYDIKGKLVRKLVSGSVIKGNHTVFWDGKNQNYEKVASGVYFVSFRIDNEDAVTKKILLMK